MSSVIEAAGETLEFRLAGRGGDAVRLPCFWFGDTVAVLPAFGSFTGTPKRVFPVGAAA